MLKALKYSRFAQHRAYCSTSSKPHMTEEEFDKTISRVKTIAKVSIAGVVVSHVAIKNGVDFGQLLHYCMSACGGMVVVPTIYIFTSAALRAGCCSVIGAFDIVDRKYATWCKTRNWGDDTMGFSGLLCLVIMLVCIYKFLEEMYRNRHVPVQKLDEFFLTH
jgi:hypothetical protein